MAEESKVAKFFSGIGRFLRDNKSAIGMVMATVAVGVTVRKVDNKIESARLEGYRRGRNDAHRYRDDVKAGMPEDDGPLKFSAGDEKEDEE